MKPILNCASEKTLLALISDLPQSLLITGPDGVGIGTVSRYIAQLRGVAPLIILPESKEKVDIEKGVISVDIMRRLYNETRTKSAGDRIIIIDYAERMTESAQNAFLKLLEEPGKGIYFILVSHSTTKLLPTILSRAVQLDIQPISAKQSEKMLDELKITDATKRSQLLFMASGLPAEITRLASDDAYFTTRSAIVRDARELLRGSAYQKLLIAQRYKDNRIGALLLLTDVMKILNRSISDNPKIESINHINAILEAYQQISAGGNIRVCLARLVL